MFNMQVNQTLQCNLIRICTIIIISKSKKNNKLKKAITSEPMMACISRLVHHARSSENTDTSQNSQVSLYPENYPLLLLAYCMCFRNNYCFDSYSQCQRQHRFEIRTFRGNYFRHNHLSLSSFWSGLRRRISKDDLTQFCNHCLRAMQHNRN